MQQYNTVKHLVVVVDSVHKTMKKLDVAYNTVKYLDDFLE